MPQVAGTVARTQQQRLDLRPKMIDFCHQRLQLLRHLLAQMQTFTAAPFGQFLLYPPQRQQRAPQQPLLYQYRQQRHQHSQSTDPDAGPPKLGHQRLIIERHADGHRLPRLAVFTRPHQQLLPLRAGQKTALQAIPRQRQTMIPERTRTPFLTPLNHEIAPGIRPAVIRINFVQIQKQAVGANRQRRQQAVGFALQQQGQIIALGAVIQPYTALHDQQHTAQQQRYQRGRQPAADRPHSPRPTST